MPEEKDGAKNLAERFQADRAHLIRVAYRMLGSLPEAEDAVQESWLRLSRDGGEGVGNLTGWLTTVVARISLDMLRKRKSRREEPVDPRAPEPAGEADDPGRERELADAVGIALLVVLEALDPAERIAFVLHDMFDLPFDEIAPIVGRTPVATRQLASRARRRVQGAPKEKEEARAERAVIDAFLLAAREGNFEGLLAALDPQVVMRGDEAAVRLGGPRQLSGSAAVAKAFQGRAQQARFILADGAPAVLVAPNGRLLLVLDVTFRNGKIAAIDAIADAERLAGMAFALPEG